MAPEELLTLIRERPFQPFRIALTDGWTFEVRHPEMVMPSRGSAVIGLPAQGDTELFYERRITVDLLHMVNVEPIQLPAQRNGQT